MSTSSSLSSTETIEKVGPDRVLTSTDLFTSDPDGAVKLRMTKEWPGSRNPVSLPTLFRRSCEAAHDLPALLVKREDVWHIWTYQDYFNDVISAAKAFIRLGLEPFHSVCIHSFNCPEWHIANVATIFAGGLACGLYLTNSSETSKYILNDSRANILIAENAETVTKYLSIKSELKFLKKIVQISGDVVSEDPDVISWAELMDFGREVPGDQEVQERLQTMAVNQCCILIYTSGTTGPPKGVMLSHDNIAWTVFMAAVELKLEPNAEVLVSYLPLNHIAAQLMDVWLIMLCQGQVWFADRMALKGTLLNTIVEARPTRFFGVPRVWEKFKDGMMESLNELSGIRKKMVEMMQAAGRRYHLYGKDSLMHRYAQSNLHQRIKQRLGLDRCITFATGAAPLAPDVSIFFMSTGMRLIDLYGMSESTGLTLGQLDDSKPFRFGSVGQGLPGIQARIADTDTRGEGEVLINGRTVMMGYLNRPDKTAETFDHEGWLITGDRGRKDADGFLKITGRSKDLIITAGGENIAPIPIEEAIKSKLPCVSNAIVIGENRKYLIAFLTLKTLPDPDNPDLMTSKLVPEAVTWCLSVGSTSETVEDIVKMKDENVFFAIQDVIDEINEMAVSNVAKIQKWTILPKDLSVEGGELGPTLKVKRFFFYDKYEKAIDQMYK